MLNWVIFAAGEWPLEHKVGDRKTQHSSIGSQIQITIGEKGTIVSLSSSLKGFALIQPYVLVDKLNTPTTSRSQSQQRRSCRRHCSRQLLEGPWQRV